jgi:hypothetical protein
MHGTAWHLLLGHGPMVVSGLSASLLQRACPPGMMSSKLVLVEVCPAEEPVVLDPGFDRVMRARRRAAGGDGYSWTIQSFYGAIRGRNARAAGAEFLSAAGIARP